MEVVKYKDSGVAWIGNIPEHWRCEHLKRVSLRIQTGTTPPTENAEYYDDGTIPWFSPGSYNGAIYLEEPAKLINEVAQRDNKLRMFPAQSIFLVGIGATIGKVAMTRVEASCNQQITGIVCNFESIPKYMTYQFKIYEGIIPQISKYTTLPIMDQVKISYLRVAIPPLAEQKRIASYLDKTCAAIDTAIEKKQKQLETLDALRKSIIHKAVTRGLDDSVELKDSGVEWIGKIPRHWKALRIKDIAQLSPGFSNGKPKPTELCTVVPMEAVSAKGLIDTSNIEEYDLITNGLTNFEVGDVIFAKITPCMENGKGAFVDSLPTRYAFGSTEFHVLRPRYIDKGKFLYYYTFNSVYRDYAEANMSGAAGQKRVSSRSINYTKIYLPPIDEQQEIINYLDNKIESLNELGVNLKDQITTLLAYRKSLIHECVTGKRRIAEDDLRENTSNLVLTKI